MEVSNEYVVPGLPCTTNRIALVPCCGSKPIVTPVIITGMINRACVAWLFAVIGSARPVAPTSAVFVNQPNAPGIAERTEVSVAIPFVAKLPMAPTTNCELVLTVPLDRVADKRVRPGGSKLVTQTPLTTEGPAFETRT